MLSLAASRMFFFFFNDTATTEIYTLSLHDALPISLPVDVAQFDGAAQRLHDLVTDGQPQARAAARIAGRERLEDRKSTRLNSSHSQISYAVFCLKKKKKYTTICVI